MRQPAVWADSPNDAQLLKHLFALQSPDSSPWGVPFLRVHSELLSPRGIGGNGELKEDGDGVGSGDGNGGRGARGRGKRKGKGGGTGDKGGGKSKDESKSKGDGDGDSVLFQIRYTVFFSRLLFELISDPAIKFVSDRLKNHPCAIVRRIKPTDPGQVLFTSTKVDVCGEVEKEEEGWEEEGDGGGLDDEGADCWFTERDRSIGHATHSISSSSPSTRTPSVRAAQKKFRFSLAGVLKQAESTGKAKMGIGNVGTRELEKLKFEEELEIGCVALGMVLLYINPLILPPSLPPTHPHTPYSTPAPLTPGYPLAPHGPPGLIPPLFGFQLSTYNWMLGQEGGAERGGVNGRLWEQWRFSGGKGGE
ncbi:hypothetical protein B484DRAFT_50850 [Ochromonadaceae sp. CCMP2298]|nr:hypothetical protein B484DRAFT_50850 [Ochromonadaceae sp. CCMP2298]